MNPENTPKTDTKTLIEALRILARDIQGEDGVANTAISEAADRLTELSHELDIANNWIEHHQNHCDDLISENAALKQRIIADNKAYGCELRDPSGTIWDYAKRLQDENAELRDKFATIPDEVWSKADLVKQIHQALAERDDANRKNAALREALEVAENGLRHGLMMEPLDPFRRGKVISTALDTVRAARKEAQP